MRSICLFASAIAALATTTPLYAARMFGVDVSHYQGSNGVSLASWNQMYAEGKRFAFIKGSEGLTGPDDTGMANNAIWAKQAGLAVGVYHYAHAENRPTIDGAILEANHLLSYAGNAIGPGYMKPVIDLEGKSLNLSVDALSAWLVAFSDTIVAARGEAARPIIYTSTYNANYELDSRLANYDLWLVNLSGGDPATDQPSGAGYPRGATGVFKNWSFWQYSFSGTAGGISPIDSDVQNSDYRSLASFMIPEPATLTALAAVLPVIVRRRRGYRTAE